ncbi:MAG: hypothetical protein COV48_00430 [Elusimicrobia bacterium CG11_big_fil_rev_8_21_14_0_20_64_6]|nr:MAG: hypothetical protein COV48_00430 [Elusimicrobia bacterium CG11_big_fil_rev_8_21_14_0_20_64_6]
MRTALLALLLLGGPAKADDGEPNSVPTGTAVEGGQSQAVAEMKRQLEGDPGLQEALVDRILHSQIGSSISGETDEKKKRAAVRAWVQGDLGSAAEVALGLAKDEADGTHLFENSVVKYLKQTFSRNNTNRGAFGVLKGAAKTSKLINHPDQEAGEEEKRELLRNLFEGKGSQGGKVITGQAPEGKPASETPASAALANSFYDRLSAGNIRGYSPQLMALQSALNTRRPPGAPALIETGKLDHATLSYPAHGLRYDIGNIEERLRRSRIAQLATLGGVRLSERDMQDPGLEARLLAKVPADKLPKRFAARAAANERARTALAAFERAAAKSKDPNQITKGLLVELSGRQREAARWLTVASLEEELARIESEEGFLTADLLAAIDAAPAPAAVRASYKRQGESYTARLGKLKANTIGSLDALQSDAWLSRISEIEKMMAESRNLRMNISRDISDYRLVPFRIGEAVLRQPRWREYLDDLLVKYARSTSHGRAVAGRRGKLARFLGIFGQIASGDLNGAHLSLVNTEGGRR